ATIKGGFDITTQKVDVDVNHNGLFSKTEGDLDNANLLTLNLTITDFFAGIPGGIGFHVSNGSLALALIKADPATNPGDNPSFLAVKAEMGNASLDGLPQDLVDITATDLQVAINQASGTSPSKPSALDWTQSVNLDANAPLNGTFTHGDVVVGGQTIGFTTG